MTKKINLKDVMKRYQALKAMIVERKEEAERFFKFIEENTSWLSAPASTRYHFNIPNGLLAHSVGVAEVALKVKELLAPALSNESVVLCSLLHDLGKVGLPGKNFYLPNPSEWFVRNRNMNYIVNPELVAMDSAVRSLYLVARGGLPLTESEAQAIVAHDGAYVVQNREYAHSETPLLLVVSFADGWHAAIYEDNRPIVRQEELTLLNLGDPMNRDKGTMLRNVSIQTPNAVGPFTPSQDEPEQIESV